MEALEDPRITLTGLFFETHAGLHGELSKALKDECELPMQWFELLLRLARTPAGALRMSELAEQSTLTASGLTRAIDRLVDAGFVCRESCESDRRGYFAVITESGRERVEAAVGAHLRHVEDCFTGVLDAGERDQLEAILRKLRDRVMPHAGDTSVDHIDLTA